MIELAGDAMFRLEYESSQDWAARAVAAAEPLGDEPLTVAALGIQARALAWGSEAKRGGPIRSRCAC